MELHIYIFYNIILDYCIFICRNVMLFHLKGNLSKFVDPYVVSNLNDFLLWNIKEDNMRNVFFFLLLLFLSMVTKTGNWENV